jgi:hypothetical protein
VKIYVAHTQDGLWHVCDERGERHAVFRARGYRAAAEKWIAKFDTVVTSATYYKGRMRASEMAATFADLKMRARKEDENAGTTDSG